MLYQYSGGVIKLDTCGCSVYACTNRFDITSETKHHSKHSKHCQHHLADTDNIQALAENRLKNDTLKTIREKHPELTQEFIELGGQKVVIDQEVRDKLPAKLLADAVWELKPDVNLSFDNKRKLTVTLPASIDPTTLKDTIATDALDVAVK